jgi:hypothetical protein
VQVVLIEPAKSEMWGARRRSIEIGGGDLLYVV